MLLNLFLRMIQSFKISCSSSKPGTFSPRCHEPLHRLAAFRHWLSKLNTVKVLEDSHAFVIWKVQSNIYKRDIWKFVVKLWSSGFFVRLWAICGERLRFQHTSAEQSFSEKFSWHSNWRIRYITKCRTLWSLSTGPICMNILICCLFLN